MDSQFIDQTVVHVDLALFGAKVHAHQISMNFKTAQTNPLPMLRVDQYRIHRLNLRFGRRRTIELNNKKIARLQISPKSQRQHLTNNRRVGKVSHVGLFLYVHGGR